MENEILSSNLEKDIFSLVRRFGNEKYSPKVFVPGEDVVPVNGKVMSSRELEYMVAASLDGWLTAGRFNKEFQDKLGVFLGTKHVLTVNSGSSANLVAFSALTSEKLGDRAIRKGDEVITVAAGFPTTVNPIIQQGAIPVFIDVDPKTHNIDVSLLDGALSDRTKAVMIAHTLGNPFDCKSVKAFCDKNNLWLVEDCCDALGATFDGKQVGSFGDIATLSFYPAHHITMGEGGVVFTNNDQLKVIAESFRDWGRDCYCGPGEDNTCGKRYCQQLGRLPKGYDHKFTYGHLGFNLKITDMQAAVGCAQLLRLEEFIAKRKENYSYLYSRLSIYSDYFSVMEPTPHSKPSWFGFAITINENANFNRTALLEHLAAAKIGTRLIFAGNLTCQPYMANVEYKIKSDLKNTDNIMRNTFWVGVYPGLDTEHLDYIISTIEAFFGLDL